MQPTSTFSNECHLNMLQSLRRVQVAEQSVVQKLTGECIEIWSSYGSGPGKVDLHPVIARCLGNTPGSTILCCSISLKHGRLLKRGSGDCRAFLCSLTQAAKGS